MAKSKAWLLYPAPGVQMAVANNAVAEYVLAPQMHEVPLTPSHCSKVIFWRDQIVPVMNVGQLVGAPDFQSSGLSVLVYQPVPMEPLQYLAIWQNDSPDSVMVDDEQSCELPEGHAALWDFVTSACVEVNGVPTPVVSLKKLASNTLRNILDAA